MSRTLLAGAALAALCASTLSAQSATAQAPRSSVPPEKMRIEVATVNGSGCPAGTAAVAVSPDNTAFTVTYSDYLAKAGAGASPTDFRKNCQLNLIVHVPQGFTYAIASADYRGFAHLERGASAEQKASYYFQGSSQTRPTSHRYTGQYSDNWQASDVAEIGTIVYAPCGERRNFNINTELRVNAGTSDPKTTSFMTMDSTDGDLSTVYRLKWKECPQRA
ncbi:DUF4360 domain-containing protein [Streptomyces sp. ODS28]|uniref:DUF4360 domain-containing protein n=1 Tax=Streptomyces sp. ODS28 TaxID=3136688 RepID=UPI0031E4F614